MSIDYQELLRKYMTFVRDEEGITYISRLRKWDYDTDAAKLVDCFTEEEAKELELIAKGVLTVRRVIR